MTEIAPRLNKEFVIEAEKAPELKAAKAVASEADKSELGQGGERQVCAGVETPGFCIVLFLRRYVGTLRHRPRSAQSIGRPALGTGTQVRWQICMGC